MLLRSSISLSALAVALGATGCSSAPTEPAPAETASHAASPTEAERVQAFLDARYTAADVRHSYVTALGQTVDCVDFFATRGVRDMAARGTPITSIPQAPASPVRKRRDGTTIVDPPQPAPMSEGVDDAGHERLCPAGTVTKIRLSPERIARAGGLDAYVASRKKHAPPSVPHHGDEAPQGSMWPCGSGGEFPEYAHVLGDVVDNSPGVAYASTEMSVYAPTISSGGHSLAQFWLFGGTIASAACSPGTCVQSIELGWEVLPGVDLPNGGVTDGVDPYVFTYSTLDGYNSTGCYDDVGGDPGSCTPFVPLAGLPSSVSPGARIAYNAPQSAASVAPVEMTALAILIAGDYWVQVSVGGGQRYYIGYYPSSYFAEPMATFQVGGEAGDTDGFVNRNIEMGTGLPPTDGYGWAAYHHDFGATTYLNDVENNYWGASSMCASVPPGYSVPDVPPYAYSTTPAPGSSSWDGYFYFGGNPTCVQTTCSFFFHWDADVCACVRNFIRY